MDEPNLYSANDYIFIVCKQAVYIKQLRCSGPIIAPLKVKMGTAYAIVCSGVKLYQYNPETGEFVLMTIENAFRKDKFQPIDPSIPTLAASTPLSESETVGSTTSQVEVKTGIVADAGMTPEDKDVEAPVTTEPVAPDAAAVEAVTEEETTTAEVPVTEAVTEEVKTEEVVTTTETVAPAAAVVEPVATTPKKKK